MSAMTPCLVHCDSRCFLVMAVCVCVLYGVCLSCMYVSLCHDVCVHVLTVYMCVDCVYVSVCVQVHVCMSACVCESVHVHTQSEVAGRPFFWVCVNIVILLHVRTNIIQNCLMLHFCQVPCSSAEQGYPCTLKPQVQIIDFHCCSDAHL